MKSTIIAIVIAIALIIFALSLSNKKNEKPLNGTSANVTSVINNVNTETETVATDNNTEVKNVTEKTLNKTEVDKSAQKASSQIIEITAKGGYTPRVSIAKAGIPTILRFNTNGTFDCSSSVRIPSLDIFKYLPQSGTTDIDLGIQSAGTLNGSCGMGMYPFEIQFQ